VKSQDTKVKSQTRLVRIKVRNRVWKNRNPWNRKVWRSFRKWEVVVLVGLLSTASIFGIIIAFTLPIALSLVETLSKWAYFYDAIFLMIIVLLLIVGFRFPLGNNHSPNNNGAHP
jgi:hypothetical protein